MGQKKRDYFSRKFLMTFYAETLLAFLAYTALVKQAIDWPLSAFMVGIIFVMGFIITNYVGKQAALDSYVSGFTKLEEKMSEEIKPKDPAPPA